MKIHPLTSIIIVAAITSAGLVYDNNIILLVVLLVSFILNIACPDKHVYKLMQNSLRFLPVVLGVFIVQMLFNSKGRILLEFHILKIGSEGLRTALAVSLRLLIILYSAIWLSRLSISDFRLAFRTLRLPETLSVLLSITLRFLPDLLSRFRHVSYQLKLRTADYRRKTINQRIYWLRLLLLTVLGWTLKDISYQAIALDIKGFRNGRKRTDFCPFKLKILDYVIIPVSVAVVFLPLFL